MKNNDVSPKAAGATVGAAASAVILYVLRTVWGIEAPAEVGAALATLLTALGGWVARDTMRDQGTGNATAKRMPVEEPNKVTPGPVALDAEATAPADPPA